MTWSQPSKSGATFFGSSAFGWPSVSDSENFRTKSEKGVPGAAFRFSGIFSFRGPGSGGVGSGGVDDCTSLLITSASPDAGAGWPGGLAATGASWAAGVGSSDGKCSCGSLNIWPFFVREKSTGVAHSRYLRPAA
jgi:hypothetical protein